jgi:hypothetical protein
MLLPYLSDMNADGRLQTQMCFVGLHTKGMRCPSSVLRFPHFRHTNKISICEDKPNEIQSLDKSRQKSMGKPQTMQSTFHSANTGLQTKQSAVNRFVISSERNSKRIFTF